MRVHRIDLYSNDKEVARFDTDGPNRRNPYILRATSGLDAEQITPQFYGQGAETGVDFTSLSLEPREVVLRIGLQPDYSVGNTPGDLRSNLLRAIASNRRGTVQLRFYENEVVVGILEGFITKHQSNLSGKDSDVFITIKCDDPIIRSQGVTSALISGFADPALPIIIDPISTSPHGFKMKVTYTNDRYGFEMSHQSDFPDWEFQLNYDFLDGDELYISSEANDKYIYRVRSAVTLHLTDTLEPGSLWPIIFPGENDFSIGGVPTDITINEWYWYETHWGI